MILSIWTTIGEKINEIAEDIKEFFLEHSRSPFLWIIIILIGLIVFEFVYKKLSKD